ncbi:MAG: hypothetical protein ACKVJ7_00665 [Candidatus Poseidoniales archaeon]|jgi:hypothetical protein|tara:strand:- start:526 stop:951 length:426 start_codon:yes stop_codon:yes gene_type:complete
MMQEDDRAQMLLATGVVLLMSLLSMAIYGVKLAGLTMAHDTVGTEVIDSSTQIVEYLPLLVEVRADEWYAGGMSELQSVESAMSSAHDDVLHHGEIRGVELKIRNITVEDVGGVIEVSCELGAADRNSMLTRTIFFSIDLD